ncbi:PepSY domain-containing protein [Hyphomonas sp.]|uniref:PepSY domain-containing protein n=1 Tax=Hyphomonas sp. TaxID=87 RepID=UPI00391917EB
MKRTLALLALAALSATSFASAQGQSNPWTNQFSPGQAREAVREGKTVPLSRIFQNLRRDHGGYQLGAELYSRGDGSTYYEIDWMTEDGRKVQFTVDAQTGQVTGRRGG